MKNLDNVKTRYTYVHLNISICPKLICICYSRNGLLYKDSPRKVQITRNGIVCPSTKGKTRQELSQKNFTTDTMMTIVGRNKLRSQAYIHTYTRFVIRNFYNRLCTLACTMSQTPHAYVCFASWSAHDTN